MGNLDWTCSIQIDERVLPKYQSPTFQNTVVAPGEKQEQIPPEIQQELVQIRAELEDGAMITAMRYSNKDNVSVRIKGKVKGGVFIFSKKMDIDETRNVSGKNLRMGGMK
jgi:hypothetical protein